MVSSDNALLIIDMQQGLFRGPVSPRSADAVLANIRLLIANACSAAKFFAQKRIKLCTAANERKNAIAHGAN